MKNDLRTLRLEKSLKKGGAKMFHRAKLINTQNKYKFKTPLKSKLSTNFLIFKTVEEKKNIMQSFDIQLSKKQLTIEPQDNGTYRILEGEEKLGVIYPEPTGNQVIWNTQDELEFDYIQQIGELITEHNK